ncbi:hypothetical protein [Plantactinospora sp. B24E8]|uniref:LysM peptidoglycan-binding domain-containing protein n=1 Tax=Plantactinospora sp. B24E8 TaxID=3153567 RepID=UPI00325F3953
MGSAVTARPGRHGWGGKARSRAATGHLRSGAVLLLLATVPLIGATSVPTPVLAASTPAPTPRQTGPAVSPGVPRYYVVGAPRDGVREHLYQIAVRTLGDGNRFREIFELNRDRHQPDGGRLDDPLSALRPGWILQLPPDAAGPDVRIGPLPSQSPTPPERSADGGGAGSSGGGATPYLIGAAGLLVMSLLIAWALRLLRRGRRSRNGAEPVAAESPDVEPVTAHSPDVGPVAVPAAAGHGAAGPAAVVPAPRGPAPEGGPASTARPAVDTSSGRVLVDLQPLAGDLPNRLNVRLLGVNSEGAGAPYAWLGNEPLPAATMPVVLGRQDGWRFFVDLGAAPDVFTVSGTPSAARRVALALAEQLHVAGVAVTVVGDALGAEVPAGYRRLATFPLDDHDIASLAEPGVLISGGLRGAELAAARGLATRTRHRVVPLLVGEVLRGRWSVRVTG